MTSSERPFRAGVTPAASQADRITATEVINGVRHLIVLERDSAGQYREVSLTPLEPVAQSVGAGDEACC